MKAFFDIDTQIDFLYPAGALYAPGAERVIPHVVALNGFAGKHGIPVISSMCAHTEDADEFRVWPPHCVVGTVGQRKPAATLMTEGRQIVVEKNELDLFSNPTVPGLLADLDVDECYVYGVLLEYCVKCAIMGLLKTGRKVYLVTGATAQLSAEAGRKVIDEFIAAGGRVVSGASITGLGDIE